MNKEYSRENKKNITEFKVKLAIFTETCNNINSELELRDLFKGVIIMFLDDIIHIYNKLLNKIPELRDSNSSKKISNLNTLLEALNGDGKIFGIDCTDIILRSYITYFYTKYRDEMIEWNLEAIKNINENGLTEIVMDTASNENITSSVSEHLNIIPEVVLMLNNLKDKDIITLLYLLNNLNTIIDIYLLKKSKNLLN